MTTTKNIESADLTGEVWREYDFAGRIYRIERPRRLFTRPGGTTHRVQDATGTVHLLPAPGHNGCVVRWAAEEGKEPVWL